MHQIASLEYLVPSVYYKVPVSNLGVFPKNRLILQILIADLIIVYIFIWMVFKKYFPENSLKYIGTFICVGSLWQTQQLCMQVVPYSISRSLYSAGFFPFRFHCIFKNMFFSLFFWKFRCMKLYFNRFLKIPTGKLNDTDRYVHMTFKCKKKPTIVHEDASQSYFGAYVLCRFYYNDLCLSSKNHVFPYIMVILLVYGNLVRPFL